MGRSGASAIIRDGAVVDESRYLTDAVLDETAGFMADALDAGQPFFAYVPFSAPHTPFQTRVEDFEAIEGARNTNERVYAAMIRRLDHAVGELINLLRARGALDDTLVVFTSDNGGAAYTGATDNGPLRGGKFTQFEGGLAVPLVVKAAGQPLAGVVDTPVLLTDLFATLLAQLGLPLPADRSYDSWNLLVPAAMPQRRLFWRSDFNLAVRDGRWKLLRNDRDAVLMLFDLLADPGERVDVSAAHPEVVDDLNIALNEWIAGLEAPRWPRVMNYRHEDAAGVYWFAI
jgi:arylsulfatase A-like enzyme